MINMFTHALLNLKHMVWCVCVCENCGDTDAGGLQIFKTMQNVWTANCQLCRQKNDIQLSISESGRVNARGGRSLFHVNIRFYVQLGTRLQLKFQTRDQ